MGGSRLHLGRTVRDVAAGNSARRLAIGVVLAIGLLGCGSRPAPSGEPVELLTGTMPFDADECNADTFVAGLLVDPEFGTTLAVSGMFDNETTRAPVMWPPGYTGRRVGSEVVVVGPGGQAVATTGQSYLLSGQPLLQTGSGEEWDYGRFRRGWVGSSIGVDMFYACGVVRPQATSEPLRMCCPQESGDLPRRSG